MEKIFQFTLRLLLVVLIGTFMSPSFAWQMIDSHSESTDTSVVVGDTGHHESHMHHHHDNGGDDDDAAHGQIGHLLSHLPAFIHNTLPMPAVERDQALYPACFYSLTQADTAPPFKPPRDFLFI